MLPRTNDYPLYSNHHIKPATVHIIILKIILFFYFTTKYIIKNIFYKNYVYKNIFDIYNMYIIYIIFI